ncbi:MAG TPA: hypothetical protein VGE01_06555 [Fimbriimonas sp.]
MPKAVPLPGVPLAELEGTDPSNDAPSGIPGGYCASESAEWAKESLFVQRILSLRSGAIAPGLLDAAEEHSSR